MGESEMVISNNLEYLIKTILISIFTLKLDYEILEIKEKKRTKTDKKSLIFIA